MAKVNGSQTTMKQRTLIALVALTILVTIIQTPQSGDTKKIKIKLKDVKKLKKYAYLLAGQRKKFYAIPFPFPLPVFVKRQHIYTQIPIIQRQVPMPQPYGSPAMSSDSYEAMASSYSTPEPKYPAAEEYYSPSNNYAIPKKPATSSSHRHPTDSSSSYLGSMSSGLASPSSKYLSQIMSLALNQASPSVSSSSSGLAMTTGRQVIGKLLSGQAKVLSPTSLLSTLKSPSIQQQSSSAGYDNEQKTSSAGSSSSSTGGSSSSADDAGGSYSSSGKETKSSSASSGGDATKPSASEQHRTRTRAHRHLRQRQKPFAAAGYQMDPLRLASMMPYSAYQHPLAAVAGLAAPVMPRLPLQMPLPFTMQAQQLAASGARLPSISSDLLASLAESQQQQQLDQTPSSQLDSQQDPQEANTPSGQQDYELMTSASGPLRPSVSPLGHQPMDSQQYLMAMQKLQRHQQQQHQQDELRLALASEREALRLAESRAILMRAHQLGLHETDQPISMVRVYRPQALK